MLGAKPHDVTPSAMVKTIFIVEITLASGSYTLAVRFTSG
jgi:hypothetical protein